ncbi:MAG: chorismate-binding protein [Rhodoluna sp.]
MKNSLNLSKESFLAIVESGKVIPLVLEVYGGNETPVGLYEKVSKSRADTFLLESAEQGVWSRFSFIGVSARAKLTASLDGINFSDIEAVLPSRQPPIGSSLEIVNEIQKSWKSESLDGLPPLTSGLVGFFAWDVIREIEILGSPKASPYKHPLLQLIMVQDLIVMDHKDNRLLIVSNCYCDQNIDSDYEYDQAVSRIETIFDEISQPSAAKFTFGKATDSQEVRTNSSKEDFIESVNRAKEYVRAGDVFQVVLSQRFDVKLKASALDLYRSLRAINPSPYMYLLNLSDASGEFAIVGSSPEALVKVASGHAIMHPIAGSRPRGANPAEDQAHVDSLLADQKERAEHLMLVDLARNDLLKVSLPETVSVTEFMKVEKFSHIMHLVSTVESELEDNVSLVDVLKATFPAGTLSGAPKPRALQIILELEPENRGIFGGVVGYLDFAGNADLAIAIRTAFVRDGMAHIQSGAGIVLDSNPEAEYQETVNKSSAGISAICQANELFN